MRIFKYFFSLKCKNLNENLSENTVLIFLKRFERKYLINEKF